MVQTLEEIRGGGGSVRVGTTGTIGSLMTRELDSAGAMPHTPRSATNVLQNVPSSVSCVIMPSKGPQQRKPSDEASSSSSSKDDHKISEVYQKTKDFGGRPYQTPSSGSDKLFLDRNPRKEKADKRGHHTVEIVDIKCGMPNKGRAKPIANRLKKIGFSKLSESFV